MNKQKNKRAEIKGRLKSYFDKTSPKEFAEIVQNKYGVELIPFIETTKFKRYAHYKWVMRNYERKWAGKITEVSQLSLKMELAKYWLLDLKSIILSKPFKRDKYGNDITFK